MKIAVVGAGAVGCYYGGLLAQSGHHVMLIGRPAHVNAICANGLVLERESGKEYIRLDASTDPDAVKGADLILVCVKSADTGDVAVQIAQHVSPSAQILSLQNSVGNAQILRDVVGCPVIAAAVYVGTEMAGPGHVRHHGQGSLMIGNGQESKTLGALFEAAGIPTKVSEDIEAVLWAKLTVNCAYNALSAITDQPYGKLTAQAEVRELITNIVAECEAVARACGVKVFDGQLQRVMAVGDSMAGQFSSTAQDLRRGRPTEIDHLNGHIVRQGAANEIPTPINQALLAMVKVMEAKVARQG